MPGPGDTWEPLGCTCLRCCCCLSAVHYPPTATFTWKHYDPVSGTSDSATVTLACSYLDCPRGTVSADNAPALGPCCDDFHFDEDLQEYVCTGPHGRVLRCHACGYSLLDPDDGTPGIQLLSDPDLGGSKVKPGTPLVFLRNDPNVSGGGTHPVYAGVIGVGFGCLCGVNELAGTFPAIPTYVNPDVPAEDASCGWVGGVRYVECDASGHVITYIPGGYDPPIPFVTQLTLNGGVIVGDGSGDYPNPRFRLFNPLDPFKFTCCPLRLRFLEGIYEPETWCDSSIAYWPDFGEWPPSPGSPSLPWNFPIPFCADFAAGGGCGYVVTGMACDCTGTTTWGCQTNPYPDFGYFEITADAECSTGPEDETNCLYALYADGDPDAC